MGFDVTFFLVVDLFLIAGEGAFSLSGGVGGEVSNTESSSMTTAT
jgi:hypothetical protein